MAAVLNIEMKQFFYNKQQPTYIEVASRLRCHPLVNREHLKLIPLPQAFSTSPKDHEGYPISRMYSDLPQCRDVQLLRTCMDYWVSSFDTMTYLASDVRSEE